MIIIIIIIGRESAHAREREQERIQHIKTAAYRNIHGVTKLLIVQIACHNGDHEITTSKVLVRWHVG